MRWTSLRQFAEIRVVRWAALWLLLVPFVARLAQRQWALSQGTGILTSYSISWIFVLLYVGGLFFAMGHGLRMAWMPRLLKHFPDMRHYQRSGRANAEMLDYLPIGWQHGKHRASLDRLVRRLGLSDQEAASSAAALERVTRHLTSSSEDSDFWAVFEALDRHHRVALNACALSYGLGLLCTGLIFFDGLIVVIKHSGL